MADWQVGDLALCVKVGPWRFAASGEISTGAPITGGMFVTVRKVGVGAVVPVILWFAEDKRGDELQHSYGSHRFVKITPPKADAFDREVIDLMAGAPATVEP